jgi:hypothetical protein
MRNASHPAGKTGGSSSHSNSTDFSRRRFLFALGATSAGAAAAPALAAAPQQGTALAEPQESASGYRETDHVRDYYDSARI